ncbi:MAG: helix-turn-helix domain-containing protein [Marinifilaceae bacterium]
MQGNNGTNISIQVFSTSEVIRLLKFGHPFRPVNSGFLLVRKGAIRVHYKLRDHVVGQFEGLLISRREIYEFEPIEEDTEVLLLGLDKDFQLTTPLRLNRLDVLQKLRMSPYLHIALSTEKFEYYWQLLSILKYGSSLRNPVLDYNFRHNLVASVLYLLLDGIEELASIKSSTESRSKKLTLDYMKLVGLHFREQRSLSFYAERLSVSSKHLSETVKKVTKKTAKELINISLIDEARLLLAERKLNIAAIAEQLNFSDQFSFSKFFKRHTNMSPSAFLKYHSEKNP